MIEKTLVSGASFVSAKVVKRSNGAFSLTQPRLGQDDDLVVLDQTQAVQLRDFLVQNTPIDNTSPLRRNTVPAARKRPNGAQAYKGNGKHKWELVTSADAGHTYRLRVPGGWLYRTVSILNADEGIEDVSAQSTVFVPVPDAVGYAV